MCLDWFVENWRKKVVYKPMKNGLGPKKWPRTLAEKAKFGQERKAYSKIAIVDCRDQNSSEIMNRKQFFSSTNWQLLKQSDGPTIKYNKIRQF